MSRTGRIGKTWRQETPPSRDGSQCSTSLSSVLLPWMILPESVFLVQSPSVNKPVSRLSWLLVINLQLLLLLLIKLTLSPTPSSNTTSWWRNKEWVMKKLGANVTLLLFMVIYWLTNIKKIKISTNLILIREDFYKNGYQSQKLCLQELLHLKNYWSLMLVKRQETLSL